MSGLVLLILVAVTASAVLMFLSVVADAMVHVEVNLAMHKEALKKAAAARSDAYDDEEPIEIAPIAR